MFFSLILENGTGDQLDMTATANQYMTSRVEGLNPPTGTISTSSYAGMDGSYLNNAFIEKRNVVIHFEMRGVGVEARRHQLYKVVKPSRYVKVYYATAGIDVFVEGYVETCEVSNFEQLVTGQISILCPDIYWYSTESVMAYYSQITGAFTFPFPTESNPEPFVLGKFNTQNIMEIINDGDEIGFTLVIEALEDARSPTLYNADTDEYLQITGDILAGDIITVTTKTGHKTVTLDRGGVKTNIINRLVSGSTWLTLREGKNRFYLRGTGLQNLKVTIVHTNAYLGGGYMQIEVYKMDAVEDNLTITLEAVCDSFSSLLWDIEYYDCGRFEVYIVANPQNIEIFQTGRIVGRDDDNQHFGIIESVLINTDIENGDYLTVRGRFLMCLLERRNIHPTYSVTTETSYSDIVRNAVTLNAISGDNRRIPGLSLGDVSGSCWEPTTTLQVSNENLMEWVYTICEKIGGTANIRLVKSSGEQYRMVFDLSEGADRSIMQEDNPHIIFSDAYSNLLSFSYAEDSSVQKNFAYIFGQGKGDERKRTTYCDGDEPTYLDRYEVYVDADDISETEQIEGETVPIPQDKYIELLKTRGSERLVQPKTASESEIAAHNTQYVYNKDYAVGDYVTVQHRRFGMMQPQIQLIGMIEGYDQNGRSLTPTFKEE